MKRSFNNDDNPEMYAKVALVERNEAPSGIALVNPRKVAKKDHNTIVELAMEIEKADNFVVANACNQLKIIGQQIQFLKQQAKQVLQKTKVELDLHHAACNFVKVSGNTYHLYKRPTGQQYFSMLSPQEWTSPHEFLGSYRLENDQSWTAAADIEKKNDEIVLLAKALNSQDIPYAIQDSPMEL